MPPSSLAGLSTVVSSLSYLHASTCILPSLSLLQSHHSKLHVRLCHFPVKLSNDFPFKMLNSWLWPSKPYQTQVLLTSQTSYISQLNRWDTALSACFLPSEQGRLLPFSESLHLLFLLFRAIFPIPLSHPSPPSPPRFLHGCLCPII